MNKADFVKKCDTPTLWAMLECVATGARSCGEPDTQNAAFMFWYETFKEIETELDRRLGRDY